MIGYKWILRVNIYVSKLLIIIIRDKHVHTAIINDYYQLYDHCPAVSSSAPPTYGASLHGE